MLIKLMKQRYSFIIFSILSFEFLIQLTREQILKNNEIFNGMKCLEKDSNYVGGTSTFISSVGRY